MLFSSRGKMKIELSFGHWQEKVGESKPPCKPQPIPSVDGEGKEHEWLHILFDKKMPLEMRKGSMHQAS